MLSVQGTYHQAHTRYHGAGRQCVANSVTAMILANEKSPVLWKSDDIDHILEVGDTLYSKIALDKYLLISELPNDIDGNCIKVVNTCSGSVGIENSNGPFQCIEDALGVMEKFAFLTVDCYTVAIMKFQDYWFFDSHSRSSSGMSHTDGTAVVTRHDNLQQLCSFVKNLCGSLFKEPQEILFEVTHVTLDSANFCISQDTKNYDSSASSEFSGFSDQSEGEISCKLYMAQEILDSINSVEVETSSNESDSSDNVPLSVLRTKFAKSDTDKVVFETDDFCDSVSDICSSGSEYKFTSDERKLLQNEMSDSEMTLSDENAPKLKKKRLRKVKKRVANKTLRNRTSTPKVVSKTNVIDRMHIKRDIVGDGNIVGRNVSASDDIVVNGGVTENVDINNTACNDVEIDCDNMVVRNGEIERSEGGESVQDVGGVSDGLFVDSQISGSNGTFDMNDCIRNTVEGVEADIDEQGVEGLVGASGRETADGMGDCIRSSERLVSTDNVMNGSHTLVCDDTMGSTCSIVDNDMIDSNVTGDSSVDSNLSSRDHGLEYRGRKRTRNPEKWKRSVLKRYRSTGREFVNEKGTEKSAKYVKPGCGVTCRFKCHSFISRDVREDIFHKFWGLGDITQQRQFILKHSEPKQKAHKTVSGQSRRSYSFKYTLPCNETPVRVCKTFLLHTLNITGQMVQTALKKSVDSLPGVCASDKRGKHHTKPNRTPEDKVNYIKSHIASFPTIPSHYCRKDSKKMYLSPDLSVPKMYNLYCEKCAKDSIQPVTMSVYRSVFDHNFNLAFFKPVKDQCDVCSSYRNNSASFTEKEKCEYESHLKNKIAAREHKEKDKLKAKSNQHDSYIASCFDLQDVLTTPKGFESALFYKRRLNTFNFSIYNLGTSEAHCYVWNESVSGRGACDISSCVFSYIQDMAEKGKKNFVFFSDNCGSQNKNKYYISMLWYALQKFNLTSVEHKYLEKGHTFNENDAVHAAIETASRHVSVYTTSQWAAIIRTARPKNPYKVKEMDISNFFNFKQTARVLKNVDLDTDREKVYWSEVRRFSLNINDPNTVTIQYDYDGPVHFLNLAHRLRRVNVTENPNNIALDRLNADQPNISWQKYHDLLSLCRSGIIPKVHHLFYLLLPHDKSALNENV